VKPPVRDSLQETFRLPHALLKGAARQASAPDSGSLDRLIHLYETILATTDDFAYIFDPQGRFLYANQPLLKVWAKSLDEVIGKTCHELGYPTWHADMHLREIEEIVRTKLSIRGEVPFTGGSGISGVYDYIFKPVLDAAGNVDVIIGTTRDVTDRKRAEEGLKEAQIELQKRADELEHALKAKSDSEQRYRFLSDTVPQIVWTAKPDGTLDYYNQRWFTYAGVDFEQMREMGWTSFVLPEDLPNCVTHWQRSIETGCDYEVEFRIRRASDGTHRWHLARAFPMRDERGKILQWVGTCTDIDDQRQLSEKRRLAEMELRKANGQLQQVLTSIKDGLTVLDKNWICTYFSDQASGIVGMPAETVVGKNIWDTFPHAKGTKFFDGAHEAVSSGKSVRFEEFYPEPINKWIECLCYPSGEGLSIYFRDITDRKHDEEELRRRDATIRNITDNAPTVIARLDRQLRHVFINPAITQATGFSVEAYLGKTNEEMGHPADLCRLWTTAYNEVFRTRLPRQLDFSFDSPHGPTFWTMKIVPEIDDYGLVNTILVVSTEITERKKAEMALRESESKLRLYFESSVVGNIIADVHGRVFEANDEYLRIIGYTREELMSGEVRWDIITPPEFLPRDHEAIELAKRTGFSGPYEKQYVRKDGTRVWVIVGFVIYDQIKTVAFVLDISGRKVAETALQEAQAKLQAHSQELEATVASRTAKLHETISELEHFSYAIVHDLRAPLRAMEGYADMMEEELAQGDLTLTREYTRRIKIASRRMDHLISDSLNYSKAAHQDLTLEPVDLFHLLDGLIQTYPNLRSEEANITVQRELPLVLGNEAALTQCFSNLLGNAVKFCKADVKPQIKVYAEDVPCSHGATDGVGPHHVRLWIEDNGVGISKEAQRRIFDLFQRATRDREGTGLGLAIVRKVVERMGGRVGVESEEGKGSRFWVELSTIPKTP
jgi:PAS domain S-box-containing protein